MSIGNGTVSVERIAGKGRGIVAAKEVKAGTVVIEDPVLVVRAKDEVALIDGRTCLRTHALAWENGTICLALGLSGLVNHTRRPELHNVTTEYDYANEVLRIRAIRDIAAGEELLFDYEVSDEDLASIYGIPRDA